MDAKGTGQALKWGRRRAGLAQQSRNAQATDIAPGITVRVAAIEDLVRDRRARGQPDDLAAAAELAAMAEAR